MSAAQKIADADRVSVPRRISVFALAMWCGWAAARASAQQVNTGVGQHNVGDGFFEGMGVGFGASGKNWFFNNGGGGAAPGVGGFSPNAGANLGFGFNAGGINGFMNIGAAQGSTRGMSSTAGSLTMMNGGSGFLGAATQQPFVTGFVPVVGDFADKGAEDGNAADQTPRRHAPTVLDERLARMSELGGYKPGGGAASSSNSASSNHGGGESLSTDPNAAKLAAAQLSSAGQPAMSIAQIQREQAAADESNAAQVHSLLKQGRDAQGAGKTGVARIYFRQAAKAAMGDLKIEVEEALRSLGDSPGNR